MKNKYEELRSKAFSALQKLAKQNPDYEEMRMIIGGADAEASLKQRVIRKSIDTEWLTRVEEALPALDIIIREPKISIEDQEEVVPVELTRVISEKSVRHLAQHTNLIREIKGDEVIPSKILNVHREETYLTYENKFINTLLSRLSAFVDRRYRALVGGSGVERDYCFDYGVDFEHFTENKKRTTAKMNLQIQLVSPEFEQDNDMDTDINLQFASALERLERIYAAINVYMASPFAQRLGRNYIRPPVIRTNAILKNKNFKDCLALWEYIEQYDKTGYSVWGEEYAEKPADQSVGDLYTTVALQYAHFYQGVVNDEVSILAKRQLSEMDPNFGRDFDEQELEDYLVYDSEYKKMVPVSRLMDNQKQLSEDEKRIRRAITVALLADELLYQELLRQEEEARRLERERIAAEQARLARLAAMEEAAKRGPIVVTYKYSFLARYIQSEAQLQQHYTLIKNVLHSYSPVASRISWKHESFRQGRNTIARIKIKGKSLYLYLALSPEGIEESPYASDVSDKNDDTKLLIKVRSARSCRYAVNMIMAMMEQLGLEKIEREYVDYTWAYETTEALVERGLVKMILPPDVQVNEFDQFVKADMSGVFGDRDDDDEEQTTEQPEEQAAVEEIAAEGGAANIKYVAAAKPNDSHAYGEEMRSTHMLELVSIAESEGTAESEAAEPEAEAVVEAVEPVIETVVEPEPVVEVVVEPEPVVEAVAEPEPVVEAVAEPEPVVEAVAEPEVDNTKKDYVVLSVREESDARYRGSYLARLLQAGSDVRLDYNEIKNELLSYASTAARIDYEEETVEQNGKVVARIGVKGKVLYLYLATTAGSYSKSNYVSSAKGKYADTTLLVKVKTVNSLSVALKLIQSAMKKCGAEQIAHTYKDYAEQYRALNLQKLGDSFEQLNEYSEDISVL